MRAVGKAAVMLTPEDDWFENEQLHFAAADGDIERMTELLALGADPNRFDELGRTPLHHAAAAGNIEAVERLLSAGAAVNARDESRAGDTALGDVAPTCSLEMATVHVRAGADPNIPGSMQVTALHRAAKRKRGDGPAVYELLQRATVKGRRS